MIAEDPLARSGIAAILAAYPGIIVQSELASPDAEAVPADVVVWDGAGGRPPNAAELGATSALIALLSDPLEARAALSAGARGVLLRETRAERLGASVLAVAEGAVVVEPSMLESLLEPAGTESFEPVPRASDDARLTPRELEVLTLMAEGLSNKLIAGRLSISDHTAKFHVNAILSKLGAETRTEAVVLAARRGILLL